MDRLQLIDEIKFNLTGGVLECDLDDTLLNMLVNASLRELQRYIDTLKYITIPYQRCIDMKPYKVNTVVKIHRVAGYAGEQSTTKIDPETGQTSVISSGNAGVSMEDPMYASMWQLIGGTSTMYNLQTSIYDLGAYNTLMQLRNTTSQDLSFTYDKTGEKLYINVSSGAPSTITIAYVPRYDDVSEITSDFWIDVLTRLCVAQAKIITGRIRTRFSQSSALWTQDGEAILAEGKAELDALREKLSTATQLTYVVD